MKKKTKFISIVSGKGGTGKTTTAINLGCALTHFGVNIIVVDANLTTPHIALNLGSPKLTNNLNDVLKGKKHITDVAYLHTTGIKIIPSDISVKEAGNYDISKINKVAEDLTGTADLILFDTSSGINKDVIEVINISDEIIIITNPDVPAVADALKIKKLAEMNNKKVLGVIVNKITGKKFEVSMKNISAMLEVPIIGIVPEDDAVKKALALQQPVVYSYSDSDAANAFKEIAANLIGGEYKASLA